MDSKNILNVDGTLVKIDQKIIDNFPDSAFDAFLSGRQDLPIVDGFPFLKRNPKAFTSMINFLNAIFFS